MDTQAGISHVAIYADGGVLVLLDALLEVGQVALGVLEGFHENTHCGNLLSFRGLFPCVYYYTLTSYNVKHFFISFLKKIFVRRTIAESLRSPSGIASSLPFVCGFKLVLLFVDIFIILLLRHMQNRRKRAKKKAPEGA